MGKHDEHVGLPLSVVVLTFNEEVNVQRCLDSVQGWCRDIFLVDSYSTDQTIEIAKRYTDKIYSHEYQGHAQQWSWALAELPFEHEWIFAMDADFVMTEELKNEITKILVHPPTDVNGYYVRHKQVFRGKFVRFGTIYPRYWLRMFRNGSGYVDAHDLVDLHFYVRGKTSKIEFDLVEDNYKERDIGFWVNKQVKFAKKQAEEEYRRETTKVDFPVTPSLFGTPDQRTLWLKSKWYRLPLFVRPFLYFFYRYFLRLGFLDGREGFVYHFTQALLYRLLVDIELHDLRKQKPKRG
jgi:glycosyltransferase involved in cell wall biosynthesis